MKNIGLFIFTLIVCSIVVSCSSSREHTASSSHLRMGEASSDKLFASTENSFQENKNVERKILYSAYISLIVKIPDSTNYQLEKIANKYKGYINKMSNYRTVIRVKSEDLKEAIKEISILGKVQSKDISGQDVTEDFLDFNIRLDNAEKSRKRYLELLTKAENVEAALKVEKELERLNSTIDLLKGKINRINHLSEFSTITVNLKEKKKPGLLGYIGIGLYHSVKWLFVRN